MSFQSDNPDNILKIFLLLAAGASILVCFAVRDYVRSLPSDGAQLVSGTVVRREVVNEWRGLKTERLEIQIDESKQTVFAVVEDGVADNLPSKVDFYYNGNAEEEVFLKGEMNPVWAVAASVGFVVLIVVVGILFRNYYRSRKNRGF